LFPVSAKLKSEKSYQVVAILGVEAGPVNKVEATADNVTGGKGRAVGLTCS